MSAIIARSCVRFANLFRTKTNNKDVTGHINFKSLVPSFHGANNRIFSTLNEKAVAQPQPLVTHDEAQEFMSFFSEIVRDLKDGSPYQDIPEVAEHFVKVLEYNVPHGKQYKGHGIIAAYKAFETPEKLSPEKIRLANILGWCVELMRAALLVEDDIEDSSKFRRGAPCWYTVEGVGLRAINDAHMLGNSFYTLLKKHFSHLDCYIPMMEMCHEMITETRIGQSLDLICHVGGKVKFNYFTMKVYSTLAECKTTYHALHLPILMAMHLAGKHRPELVKQVDNVLQGLGQFHQIENDILDCFGDLSQTGKNGGDIAEGKCTWLAVMALQRATPAQRNVFQKNYGRLEPECEAIVRNLYEEMHLLDAYLLYKKKSFNLIRASIDRMGNDLPKQFFYKFLKQMYKEDY